MLYLFGISKHYSALGIVLTRFPQEKDCDERR